MIIYKKNSTDQRCKVKKVKYNGMYLKVSYVECTIESATPIAFEVGDYIIHDYTGLKYFLRNEVSVKKQSSSGSYKEAFVYAGVKFKSATYMLEECMFLDIVANDNTLAYTSLPEVTTYEDVYGIAERIQANVNYQYHNKWEVQGESTSNSEVLDKLSKRQEFKLSNRRG